MGRVDSGTEAQAIAKARNAVTVPAVLGLLVGAICWFLRWKLLANPGQSSASPAEVATVAAHLRTGATLCFVMAALHVVCIIGLQKVVTAAWLVLAGFYVMSTIGVALNTLADLRVANVAALLLDIWILSRLLDADVVRVFLRSGKRATPPPGAMESDPAWRLPAVPPFPVAQPITAPVAPAAPVAQPRTSAPYDFFG